MMIFDEWRLLPQRFAVHVPSATAVLADVHLGYAADRQRRGDAVPSRSVADEMLPLIQAARHVEMRNLVVAGDLFERAFNLELMSEFLEVLQRLQIQFLGLVPGNHDRGIDKTNVPLFANGYNLHGWHIAHGDEPCEHPRSVTGHWHPALRMNGRKLPCFLAHEAQLILPAFSLDAAGVDVTTDRRWETWSRYAIEGTRVFRRPR